MKHNDQGNPQKREFIWTYGSRGLEFLMVEWRQQGADMPAGADTEGFHLELQAGSRERELEMA